MGVIVPVVATVVTVLSIIWSGSDLLASDVRLLTEIRCFLNVFELQSILDFVFYFIFLLLDLLCHYCLCGHVIWCQNDSIWSQIHG